MGSPTPDRPPTALSGVKLATGNEHLVKFGVHPLRQHAGTIGEHVKPTFVASNGFVYTALVALALIIGLWKQRVSVFIPFSSLYAGH